jgi:hypothetical protein
MKVCGQTSQVGFLTRMKMCFRHGEKGKVEKPGTGDIYAFDPRPGFVLSAYLTFQVLLLVFFVLKAKYLCSLATARLYSSYDEHL